MLASGLPFTVLRFNLWPETLFQVGVAARAVAAGVLPSNAGDGRAGFALRAMFIPAMSMVPNSG